MQQKKSLNTQVISSIKTIGFIYDDGKKKGNSHFDGEDYSINTFCPPLKLTRRAPFGSAMPIPVCYR